MTGVAVGGAEGKMNAMRFIVHKGMNIAVNFDFQA
jgi:hypothetical protein